MDIEPIIIDIGGMRDAIIEFLDVFLNELFVQLSALFMQLADLFSGFIIS